MSAIRSDFRATGRLWAVAAVAVAGCTRVVSVDVEEGPRRLVVEGRIELGGTTQRLRLTTTDVFSSPTPPPPVTGAVVAVTDNVGARCDFTELADSAGVYRCDLAPVLGATYTLSIDYAGERYQAIATLADGPPIDSLYFEYEEKGVAQGDSGYRAVIDYTDPAAEDNYYLWELLVDGEPRIKVDPGNRFRVISQDRFYDGGEVIGYQPFDEEVVDPGQVVRMRQVALTEEAFRYYFTLFEQTQPAGPFSTPPASVRGNVANLTDPEHRALGFFLAGRVSERVARVPPRNAP